MQNLLEKMQQRQAAYDEKYMDINEGFEKLRHILLHLMKSVGKLASYCELKEHNQEVDSQNIIKEVLPDLYLHALQIANFFEVNLQQQYESRIENNRKRIEAKKQDG